MLLVEDVANVSPAQAFGRRDEVIDPAITGDSSEEIVLDFDVAVFPECPFNGLFPG